MNGSEPLDTLRARWRTAAGHSTSMPYEYVEASYAYAEQLRMSDAGTAREVMLSAYDVLTRIADERQRVRASLKCYRLLADTHFRQGDIGQCQRYLLSALELLETAPEGVDPSLFQYIYNLQGISDAALGQHDMAILSYIKALDYAEFGTDINGQMATLLNLGISYGQVGNLPNAIDTFKLALGRDPDRVAHLRHHVLIYNNLAFACQTAGRNDEALQYAQQGMALLQGQEAPDLMAVLCNTIGRLLIASNEFERARTVYAEALTLARQAGQHQTETRALRGFAETEWALGHHAEAVAALETLVQTPGTHRDLLLECYDLLATYSEALGEIALALRYHRKYHTLFAETLNEHTQRRIDQLQVTTNIALARKDAELYRMRSDELQQKVHEAQIEMLERLAVAVEKRDDATGEHMRRVSSLMRDMALRLGFTQERADLLAMASRLHDVGKIGIPDLVLLKPGKLDDLEFQLIKSHTTVGAEMLSKSDSPLLKLAEVIALSHHENWDGSGYPAGLHGEDIPLEGRMVAVIDAYDALISERPYKAPWTTASALAELRRCAGTQFDPTIVEHLCILVIEHQGENPRTPAV